MRRYSVGGRAAGPNNLGETTAQLWNPSSTRTLWVCETHVANTAAAGGSILVQRTTVRGTSPGSTETPDIDSDYDRDLSPPSGTVLELSTWTGSLPTLDTSVLSRYFLNTVSGSAFMWVFPRRIKVKPGTGLALVPIGGTLAPHDVTFIWEE